MKKICLIISFFVYFVLLAQIGTFATEVSYFQIEHVRQTGSVAKVEVSLNNFTNTASGSVLIDTSVNNDNFVFVDVDEKGKNFNVASSQNEKGLLINFVSRGGGNISGENEILCYLIYNIDKNTQMGSYIKIDILDFSVRNNLGSSVNLEGYHGKIEKNYTLGDYGRNDRVSILSAMKIMKYARENKEFENHFVRNALDVNADGEVDLIDAQMILDYLVGKKDSFLTITTDSNMPTVLLNNDFSVQLDAKFGVEPYRWSVDSNSMLPLGLELDKETGFINGTVTSTRQLGDRETIIQVADINGNSIAKGFNFNVVESQIEEINLGDSISVVLGEEVNLPSEVEVFYKDGTSNFENVKWDEMDVNYVGRKDVNGKLVDLGIDISIEVIVIDKNYLLEKTINYFGLLNIHSILLEVSDEVFAVKIDGMDMLYEGDNRFGRNTSLLSEGSKVEVIMYDRFGNVLQTKNIEIKET